MKGDPDRCCFSFAVITVCQRCNSDLRQRSDGLADRTGQSCWPERVRLILEHDGELMGSDNMFGRREWKDIERQTVSKGAKQTCLWKYESKSWEAVGVCLVHEVMSRGDGVFRLSLTSRDQITSVSLSPRHVQLGVRPCQEGNQRNPLIQHKSLTVYIFLQRKKINTWTNFLLTLSLTVQLISDWRRFQKYCSHKHTYTDQY